ncbi:MAG: helix-turn-helix transcriptional regulator [Acidobacteriia bacterium]|nr:helix-turn-helix transcriptional regulator [Terriglobia bacterium]
MDPRILRTLAAIEGDCAQCLRVSRLAAQVGLSRSRFEHLFKEQTGETLKSRLRLIRLTKAQSLLADYSLRIKEVASECGYSSSACFAHDFKKAFHVSPSQYRRSTFWQQTAHFIN